MNHQNASKASGTGFSSTNFFQTQQGNGAMKTGPRTRASPGQNRPNNKPFVNQNNGNSTPSGPRSFNNTPNTGRHEYKKLQQQRPQQQRPQQQRLSQKPQQQRSQQQKLPQKPRDQKLRDQKPQDQKPQDQKPQQLRKSIKYTPAITKNPNSQENYNHLKPASFESKFMGSLVVDPSQLGFVNFSHRKRPTPKYLLKEQVLFDSSSFVENEWDINNQHMLQMRESQFNGDAQVLFEEFQGHRKKERDMMESLNFVDKENAKKSLNDAIVFRGSCKDMCPTYERVERVYKNQVSKWEKDPQTGKISRNFALKTFMRPSGQAPPLPSDVRSPAVLQMSLNYIIDNLLPNIKECQSFIWDRTRSIRQDFTFQNNYSGYESIDCHEKICRIHILSLHVMAGADDPDYQQQQELEQFNNSLKTLVNMYDDVKMRGGSCPNEPEFRAYEIIVKLKDFELERSVQNLPRHILDETIVQRALMLRGLINHGIGGLNLYSEFFKTVLDPSKTPFLLACLAEIHFNEIRYNALKQLSKLYHSKTKKTPTAEYLANVLGFDSFEALQRTCNIYKIDITIDEEGVRRLNILGFNSTFKASQKQAYTFQINNMIDGRTMQQIVNSGSLNVELKLSEPMPDVEIARRSFKESSENTQLIDKTFSNPKIIDLSSMKPLQAKPSGPKSMTVESSTNLTRQSVFQPPALSSTFPQSQTQENSFPIPQNLASAALNPSTSAFGNTPMSALSSIENHSLSSKPKPERKLSSSSKFNPPSKVLSSFAQLDNTSKPLNLPITTPSLSDKQKLSNDNKPIFGFPSAADIQIPSINNVQSTKESKTGSSNVPFADELSASSPQSTFSPVKVERVIPKKKLVDNPGFNAAAKEEMAILLDDVLTKKMEEIVKLRLQNELSRRKRERERNYEQKRQQTISILARELFNAFMDEQIYLNTLETKARHFADLNTKRFAIKSLMKTGKQSVEKYRLKEEKIKELDEFNNSIVINNKPTSSSLTLPISTPNSRSSSVSFSTHNINDRVTKLFNRVNPERDYKAILVFRDNLCPVSEWVSQYCNFILPEQQVSTIVSDNDHGLTITKLPENFKAETYFEDVNLIILQVGSVPSDENGLLLESLKRDRFVIAKLIGYLKKYSKYNIFGIIITFVDHFNVKLPTAEVIKCLGLKDHQDANTSIGFINLSDISGNKIIESNLNVLNKKRKMLDQVIEKVIRKVIDSENKVIETSIMSASTTSNNTMIGKSFAELVQPMNKELLERYTSRKHDRLTEILKATKVKRRRVDPFDSRNTTLDLRNASRMSTPGPSNAEMEELDALAESILKH